MRENKILQPGENRFLNFWWGEKRKWAEKQHDEGKQNMGDYYDGQHEGEHGGLLSGIYSIVKNDNS